VRQQAIAAVFGVGVAACVQLRLCYSWLSTDITRRDNGPFHSAIISVLGAEAPPLVESVTTLVSGLLLLLALFSLPLPSLT